MEKLETLLKEAKSLLELSSNNPKFYMNYERVYTQLNELRDASNDVEIRYLMEKLNYMHASQATTYIANIFQFFEANYVKSLMHDSIIEKFNLKEIIEAKIYAEEFIKVANFSLESGMHKENNQTIQNYILKLTISLAKEIEENNINRYETFNTLSTVLIAGYTKGMASRVNSQKISPVIEHMCRELMQQEEQISKENSDELYKLYIHRRILMMLFVKDWERGIYFYKTEKENLDLKLNNREITTDEFTKVNNRLINAYTDTYLVKKASKYEPILTFVYSKKFNTSLNDLLIYSDAEMFESFEIAYRFLQVYTKEKIEKLALQHYSMIIDIRQRKGLLSDKEKNELVMEVLILLRDNHIIDMAKFLEYKANLLSY